MSTLDWPAPVPTPPTVDSPRTDPIPVPAPHEVPSPRTDPIPVPSAPVVPSPRQESTVQPVAVYELPPTGSAGPLDGLGAAALLLAVGFAAIVTRVRRARS